MKKSTEKWKPVYKTEASFTSTKIEEIFKSSKVPGFRFNKIKDPEALSERLNEIGRIYHTFKHMGEIPAAAKVRKELIGIQKLSKALYQSLATLSYPAKKQIKDTSILDVDILQHNVLGLHMTVDETIKSIKASSGAPKKSRSTFIIRLSVIYQEVTGRKPRLSRSRKNYKPEGPFFRFVKNCLKCIDPSEQIGDEALVKVIQKALNLREKYLKLLNSDL